MQANFNLQPRNSIFLPLNDLIVIALQPNLKAISSQLTPTYDVIQFERGLCLEDIGGHS